MAIRIEGVSPVPMRLQYSTDYLNWTTLQTVILTGTSQTVYDNPPGNAPKRFYRLKSDQPSVTLSDLSLLPNQVFPAGEFGSVQFSSSGKLGFIFWKASQLFLRERSTDGSWTEEVVSSAGRAFTPSSWEDHRFQPQSALLYDSQGRPNIFRLAGNSVVHHQRQSNGTWGETSISVASMGSSFPLFTAAIGPNDKFHLALVSEGSSPGVIHGSNKSGSWVWSRAANVTGNPRGFIRFSWAPRFFSLAVDTANAAHIAYTPQFLISYPGGYARPYSELGYATDRGGSWSTQRVYIPNNQSADAGLGASIAIGPDNQPAIASWYDERADTGSSIWSQLLFHRRDGAGNWSNTVIPGRPDGYNAGDGERGIGFAPHLRFDGQGRPNILFSDHATQHFPASGQNEFAGQIRHARLDGSSWNLRTIYRQSNPVDRQMIYPQFALFGNELYYLGLNRQTAWGPDSWPRVVVSTYQFVYGSINL